MTSSAISRAKLGLAGVITVTPLLWGAAATLAHSSDSIKSNPTAKILIDNQYLIQALNFVAVALSAFLSQYGGRSIIFALGSLFSFFMHFKKDEVDHKTLDFFDAITIAFLGLAALSKGFVLGVPKNKSPKYELKFSQSENLKHAFQGWKENLKKEINIMSWNAKNFPTLCRDLGVGLTNGTKSLFSSDSKFSGLKPLEKFQYAATEYSPNFFQSTFQLTGLMRLLAFLGVGINYLFSQSSDDTKSALRTNFLDDTNTDDSQNKEISERKGIEKNNPTSFWSNLSSSLVTLSLIPAAFTCLSNNAKWGRIPNLLFNLSALFAIPGIALKFIDLGDTSKAAGGMCTKLLFGLQTFAYAVSQVFKK